MWQNLWQEESCDTSRERGTLECEAVSTWDMWVSVSRATRIGRCRGWKKEIGCFGGAVAGVVRIGGI